MNRLGSLSDIAVNLIVGLVGAAIGWAWRSFQKAIKLRYARRFWDPFTSGEVRLVVGRFRQFAEFEPTGFVGVGDANALAELGRFLNILGLPDPIVSYGDAIDGDQRKANLVLMGGPDVNEITREVMARITTGLQFGDPSRNEIAIRDLITGSLYAPLRQESSGEIGTDYAAIIRCPNPFNPSNHVLIVAGSFGYGTWAGIRFVMSREFLRTRIASRGISLEALIESEVYAGTPQRMKAIVLRPLKNS